MKKILFILFLYIVLCSAQEKRVDILEKIQFKYFEGNWINYERYLNIYGNVGIKDSDYLIMEDYKLEQNYPNPFNPSTTISFSLPMREKIALNIFNSKGEIISELVNKYFSKGMHEVKFDASNLPTGQSFYQLKTKDVTKTNKMILIK